MNAHIAEAHEERRAELRIGAPVVCRGGEAGRLERLIFNPRLGMVTDIVIHRGFIGHRDRVIPLAHVRRITDEAVELDLALADLERFAIYDPSAFTTPSPEWQAAHGYRPQTAVLSLDDSESHLQSLAPEHSGELEAAKTAGSAMVVVSEGMEVVLRDRVFGQEQKVGRVALVLLEPQSRRATHIVIRKGRLARRDLIVPLDWAIEITPTRITLDAEARQLDHLPEYRPDDEIGYDVEQALFDNPAFHEGADFYTIRTAVRDGIVLLEGNVRDSARKREAEQVARRIRGVLDVRNEIIPDDELVFQVERALRRDDRLEIRDLRVEVLLGLVLLHGRVESKEQREEAARVAHRVRDVQAVSNSLVVYPSATHHTGDSSRE